MTNLWEFVEQEIGPLWVKQKDPTPSHTSQQANVDEDLMLFNQAIMIATTKSEEVSHC